MIKDSGERHEFDSGMVRDVTTGKVDYSLVLDGPMFERWAAHMTAGAVKYAKRNWMQANGEAELARFKESALRHFLQWFNGDTDEDHAAAVLFNVNGAEYVKARTPVPSDDPNRRRAGFTAGRADRKPRAAWTYESTCLCDRCRERRSRPLPGDRDEA